MDKTWTQSPLNTTEYREGVTKFLDFAFKKVSDGGKILCPCKVCLTYLLETRDVVEEHLMSKGFITGHIESLHHEESAKTSTEAPLVVEQAQLDTPVASHDSDMKREVSSKSLAIERPGRVRGLGLGLNPSQVYCSCTVRRNKRSIELQELKRQVEETRREIEERDEKWDKRMKKLEEEVNDLKNLINPLAFANLSKASATRMNPEASSSQDVNTSVKVNNDMN